MVQPRTGCAKDFLSFSEHARRQDQLHGLGTNTCSRRRARNMRICPHIWRQRWSAERARPPRPPLPSPLGQMKQSCLNFWMKTMMAKRRPNPSLNLNRRRQQLPPGRPEHQTYTKPVHVTAPLNYKDPLHHFISQPFETDPMIQLEQI